MQLIILKTNIENKHMLRRIQPVLDTHQEIISWHVDMEDIDNVLRIESTEKLNEYTVHYLIHQKGLISERMPD